MEVHYHIRRFFQPSINVAYKKFGQTRNCVPTMKKIEKLGLNWMPEVVDIVKKYESSEPPQDTLPTSDEAWK